jgi:hypothetical protein
MSRVLLAILRFMQTSQELLSPYELANRIVAEAPGYREKFPALVERAREYADADNARRKAGEDLAESIRKGRPHYFVESPERVKAKAYAACDAFVKEYDACRAGAPSLG